MILVTATQGEWMYFIHSILLLFLAYNSPSSIFFIRKADLELGEGGHFGELNLLTGRPSIANVTVLTPKARLMAVTKKDYNKR